jgi:beta-N-acetylhexosaminidase
MTRFHLRRLLALMALAAVAGAVVAIVTGGGGSHPARHGGKSLLDALAPLLAAPATATVSTPGQPSAKLPDVAAELFLVGFPGTGPDAPFFTRLRQRAWGGVVLDNGNYASQSQLQALTRHIAFVARSAHHPVPLVAAIQLGGQDSAFPDLPPTAEPAVAGAQDAAAQAVQAGTVLRRLGVTMTLGPAADLATAGGAWADRSYAPDPATAAADVSAAVQGYAAARVLSAPGHFPGEGAASQDPSQGPTTVGLSLAQLRTADLEPFAAIVKSAPAIQLSSAAYAAWDGVTPATLLPQAVKLLRGMGFQGAIVSGDLQAATLATGGTPAQAAVQALKAGCDLLYLPGDASDQEAAWAAVASAIRSGQIPPGRLADALAHVEALQRASH